MFVNKYISVILFGLILSCCFTNNIMALAKKEASSNIPNANKNLGVINMMRGNIEGAINFFEIDANQGDVESQTFLGMIYINSEYRFLDYSKAMYWFSLASEKNTLQQCII